MAGLTSAPSSEPRRACPDAIEQAPGDRRRTAARLAVLRARRRRVLLGAVSAVLLVALALPWGGAGRQPLATTGSVLAGAAVSPHSLYVVQAGDTMWSIAERLAPGGDPRPMVSRLEAEVGSDTLRPGERLHLP